MFHQPEIRNDPRFEAQAATWGINFTNLGISGRILSTKNHHSISFSHRIRISLCRMPNHQPNHIKLVYFAISIPHF